MKTTKPLPDLPRSKPELLALAAVIRPDVRTDDLEGAILACGSAGWTWRRTVCETVLMLCRDEWPSDLRTATLSPLKRKVTP